MKGILGKSKLFGVKPKKGQTNGANIQGLALEIFKKFDINIDTIKNEVALEKFEMIDYEEKSKTSIFGEKESISYTFSFCTYNIHFKVKLLTFEYGTKTELLKLDLECITPEAVKEIKYCCNSLQRRRNLNLMFLTLISFARFFEARRLVCDLILNKSKNIQTEENKEGGKVIVYTDEEKNIKLGIFWSIECNSEHEILDKIEVYYKFADLPNKRSIITNLTELTEPHLEFNQKFRLWKEILNDLKYHPDAEEFFVISRPGLLPQRYGVKVKKEEPLEDHDISSSCAPDSQNPIVCIKNAQSLSKHSNQASIILSNCKDTENTAVKSNQNTHIIYMDTDDMKNMEPSTSDKSKPPRIEDSSTPSSQQRPLSQSDSETDCIPRDTDSVIILSSDSEDKEKPGNSSVDCAIVEDNSQILPDSTCRRTNSPVIDIDIILPSKRPKVIDDDLEIIGITYVIPD